VHHRAGGHPSPARDPRVLDVLSGIRRHPAVAPPRRVAPALTAEVQAMITGLDPEHDPTAARDAALILLGYTAALRRSELAALTLADITEQPDEAWIEVFLASSKTDQHRQGHTVRIPATGGPACPVAAWTRWRTWLTTADQAQGRAGARGRAAVPAWRRIRKGRSETISDEHGTALTVAARRIGTAALTDRSIADIIRRRAADAHLPGTWSGHSLRRGFATQAYAAGVDELAIMRHGRWRSAAVMRTYIAEADRHPPTAPSPRSAWPRSRVMTDTGASGPRWDAQRRTLHAHLHERDEELAALYAGVIARLETAPPTPAAARERLVAIAHAMRELVTCLPSLFGYPNDRSDTASATEALQQEWEHAFDELGNPDPERFRANPDAAMSVRRKLIGTVAWVVTEQAKGTTNNVQRQSGTVLGRYGPREDPTLRRWLRAHEWFNRHAHLDRSRRAGHMVPGDDELLEQLVVVEDTLTARFRGFFEVMEELAELITAANAANAPAGSQASSETSHEAVATPAVADAPKETGTGYATPTDDLLDRALARVGDVSHRRAFYEQLQNPQWVEPLAARGAFRRAEPPTDESPDELPLLQPWPEGEYLARMAPAAPAAVAAVLADHMSSTDDLVRRFILRAAARMPAENSGALASGIAMFIGSLPHLAPSDPPTLIHTLLAAGKLKPARKIIDAVYDPKPDIVDGQPISPFEDRVRVGLDPYLYAQTLPDVARALVHADRRTLAAVAGWLEHFQTHTGKYDPSSTQDVSAAWRPSIRPHPQNWGVEDIGDVLVDSLRELTLEQLTEGRPVHEIATALQSGRQPLLSRVLIDSLAALLESDPHRWPDLADLATDLLLDPTHLEAPFRPETAALARVVLPHLADTELERLVDNVHSGPPQATDEQLADYLVCCAGNQFE